MRERFLAGLLDRLGFLRALEAVPGRPRLVALNYHRIGHDRDSPYDPGLWSADPESFAAQVRYLKRHFDLVLPEQLDDVARQRRGRFAMITFDDGYRDNHDVAFPILRAENASATFFVATGYIDAPRVPWWDEVSWMLHRSPRSQLDLRPFVADPVDISPPKREHTLRSLLRVYKALPQERTDDYLAAIADATGSGRHPPQGAESFWMNWDMLRAMSGAGMTIGGHTVNHPVLARMDKISQQQEIKICVDRLKTELGRPVRSFSYPVGAANCFNQDTRDCLREVGVDFAFTYYGGYSRPSGWDRYDIPRVAIEPYIDASWFRAIAQFPEVFA
ncbi:MAG TPA: polysaccharide deacetylase family protein [Rhodanobacteraceae bacterium]|nr:polysaccharide deacetylase family protein [Rhodanobacteraceae bacterium]